MSGRIVLLAVEGDSTRQVLHALAREWPDVQVVLESPVERRRMLGRRVKRLGLVTVAGQVAFMALLKPLLSRVGRRRIAQVARDAALDAAPIPDAVVRRVGSVNSDEARALLRELSPEVVVLNGTRIVSPRTLGSVDAPFLNMHAGITPAYRGVHGAYWALCEGRPDLVGTTVHYVDAGIDTGSIISQHTFPVTGEDSFATYPTLHVAAGLPGLVEAVRRILAGAAPAPVTRSDIESRLRTHPTLWGYLWRRLRRGVR